MSAEPNQSSQEFVGINEGLPLWTEAALEKLKDIASVFGSTIYYSELAQDIQHHTGAHTRSAFRNWIGKVLESVDKVCRAESLPPLASLAVRQADGRVGAGYDHNIKAAGQDAAGDPFERNRQAVFDRLECYRSYCSSVPADAEEILQAQVRKSNSKPSRKKSVEKPAAICQDCFIQLPMTGICPNCEDR
ncbi:hypothetical protein [Micrococcoides hystricis]|uniref:Uncharacterized protein n=1 Tax=Micrococcoides hystricis TaxID=1572761 RepID=A0ABV6PA39_9MICC